MGKPMYYKDICDKIDELREERGLSRREIARRAGINQNTFGSYFKRKRGNFPEEQIEAVARVLGVSPATLKGANLRVLQNAGPMPVENRQVRMADKPMQMESTCVVNVIRSVHPVGTGTPDDPIRMVVQYWSFGGDLLAELDFNDDPYSPLRQ